jgi:hypothetical protein
MEPDAADCDPDAPDCDPAVDPVVAGDPACDPAPLWPLCDPL